MTQREGTEGEARPGGGQDIGGREKLASMRPPQGKIYTDIIWLREQIQRHKTERREDWAFFTVFMFVLLDFVFFAILQNFWLPAALCAMQVIALALLVWQKGAKPSVALAASMLLRIVGGKQMPAKTAADGDLPPEAMQENSPDAQDALYEALDESLAARSQDWFVFIALTLIFLDVVFFAALNNWAAPIALLILEGFALFALGEKMGMKGICELISTLLGIAAKKMSDKS